MSSVDNGQLTQRFAELIISSQPGSEAIAAARGGLLDFLASAIAGLDDPAYVKLRTAIIASNSVSTATLIGWHDRLDPANAALINGYLGHALDYDDIQSGVRGHPSTVILPALLAAAETSSASAIAVLEAYVVGVEAMARLGRAMGQRHYEVGFHNTATLGPIGAAAALSRLHGFDARKTAQALGIAATQSSGLRLQFGSDIKPLHAGLAARSGLLAVELVQAGLVGADAFLDGPINFLTAFGQGRPTPALAVEGWGAPWEIVSPGLIFKQYPCCGGSHAGADAILDLKVEHDLAPADIESVTVTFPVGADAALVVTRPTTGLEGRFSIEYVVATALVDGKLGVQAFSDEPIRADIAALLPRISRSHDLDAPTVADAPHLRFTRVDVVAKDGRRLSRTVTKARGAKDLRAKFADATASRTGADVLPGLVADMESAADFTELTRILRTLSPILPPTAPTSAAHVRAEV
jgi:2-methylcitrate dehydratase PrpD